MKPWAKLLGLVAFVAVAGLHAGAASASEVRLPRGLVLRDTTRISQRGLALAPVSNTAALTARLEVGPAGTGAALGIMKVDGSSHVPALEHVGVELHAVRMCGPTSPSPATWFGPQLALGSYFRQMTVGWVFDVDHPDDNHPQVSLGVGF